MIDRQTNYESLYLFEKVIERTGYFYMERVSLAEWQQQYPKIMMHLAGRGITIKEIDQNFVKLTGHGSRHIQAN